MGNTFNDLLVQHLQPLRSYFLSIVLYHFYKTGIYGYLKVNGKTKIENISSHFNYDFKRIKAVFNYLEKEKYVIIAEKVVCLSEKGYSLDQFWPWYELLIGGYGKTMNYLSDCLIDSSHKALRNLTSIGLGSCGISMFDTIPLIDKVINEYNLKFNKLLDLGCGTGCYLMYFCNKYSNLIAVGIEDHQESYENTLLEIEKNNLENRAFVHCCSIDSFVESDEKFIPDLIIGNFVLHEFLDNFGEKKLEKFLSNLILKYSGSHFIFIEVDGQKTLDALTTDMGLAYYNPYFLLHDITSQQLKPSSFWINLFEKVGFSLVATAFPDREIDPTNIEIAYILKHYSK